MTVHQLSVFIENKSGALVRVLRLLKQENIQLIATTIADTVDYGKVFSIVKDYVENASVDLIEYMAYQIIVKIMRAFSEVKEISCEIQKPRAPIDGDFDYMSVIISRTRDEMEKDL